MIFNAMILLPHSGCSTLIYVYSIGLVIVPERPDALATQHALRQNQTRSIDHTGHVPSILRSLMKIGVFEFAGCGIELSNIL